MLNISFAGLKFTRSIKILKSKSLSEQNSVLNSKSGDFELLN